MDEFEKYLNSALKFLSFRPRSEKEVHDNLLKKKATPEVIERIINTLKEQKFLNDEDFTKWWIEQRLKFRPRSLKIIKLELRQKGIIQDIIDEARLSLEKDEDNELTNNDLASAKKLVNKKLPRYANLEKQEVYQKLGGFLARKGFDWDTIKKSIDDVLKDGV